MQQPGDLANILAVVGFFILLYGTISYGGQIFGKLTGTQDSVFIGAAGCTGLTGATLAACQKAQPKPKPKPQGITPAPKRGITPAKPKPKPPVLKSRFDPKTLKRPINLKRLYDPQRRITASPLIQRQKICNDLDGTWSLGRCLFPITPTNKREQCAKRAEAFYFEARFRAYDQLARQNGVDVFWLMNNTATNLGMQYSILRKKYNDLVRVLEDRCRRAIGLKTPSVNWDKGAGFGAPSQGHTPFDPSSQSYNPLKSV